MIKEIYTVTESDINDFNKFVKRIVDDLQYDGLKVKVQFSTTETYNHVNYSAMITGEEK